MTASRRFLRFGLAVAMAAILIAWAGRTTWREVRQLRASFSLVESDSFHVSDYIEAPIRNMNEALLEHDLRKDEVSKRRFLDAGEKLKQWIGGHADSLATADQRQKLAQVQAALEVYLSQGAKLMDDHATADGKPVLEQVETNAAPLLALCEGLARTERVALAEFMQESGRSLIWVEGLLAVLLVLVLGLGAVVGLSGYRELLAPLRRQLRQSRAVIERNEKLASLGTLAAGVAHEIRNPLTAINVRIHSLKRSLVSGSSEHEDATVIDEEIKRLEAIVQAFLQFARPAEPKFVTVSADSLLVRVRALLAGQMEKVAIQLLLEAPPDLWVRVDPQQIEQVLINLVQNAAESIGRDGVIRLRARKGVERLGGRSSAVVVLEVSDTGKGIPPEVQKRLFDPFFTTKEEGTGLGLSIAMRIIEQQGGALHYTTQLDRGTTFSLILPEAEHHSDESSTKDTTH
ncbi:MAG TPA: ATP-binding protein [Verrucomicrobiae bacterium]|nr:ATP-binding protein [Verrucomicrobiae bacterium]